MRVKRTTVILPDELKRELKHIAADLDISFTMVLTAAAYHLLEDYKSGRVGKELFDRVSAYLRELRG